MVGNEQHGTLHGERSESSTVYERMHWIDEKFVRAQHERGHSRLLRDDLHWVQNKLTVTVHRYL